MSERELELEKRLREAARVNADLLVALERTKAELAKYKEAMKELDEIERELEHY